MATNGNSVVGNNFFLFFQIYFGKDCYPGFLLSQTLGIQGELWESLRLGCNSVWCSKDSAFDL